jgi:hypothetical protein
MLVVVAGLALGVVTAVTAVADGRGARPTPLTTPVTDAKMGIASSMYVGDGQSVKLAGIGARWTYDWSATAPPADLARRWVPMVWGSGSLTPQVIATLKHDRKAGSVNDLLGFNEPDNGGQSNMTPQQAAALWPRLESTGLPLGSPAPATPTDGWLTQFMALVRQRHLRVNFIALHYYQDFTNPDAVAQLRSQLIAIHRAYGRPIWITEIGAIDIRSWGEPMEHAPTEARAVSYMRSLFAMLNRLPFVHRYAWFTDNCWNDSACHTSSLFNGQGQLTPLGRAYRSLATG